MDLPSPSPQLRAAIEALYDNEALTDGLDDESAEVLLDWGVENLHRIFTLSPDSGDPEAADARQTANRRLLRRVKVWALEPARDPKWLEEIVLLADEAGLTTPPPERRAEFLENGLALPAQPFIQGVRALFSENET